MSTERHLLGLSGGRDSAALAVFMRQRFPDVPIEYFFTDTGKELPEVYEFLSRLEGFLGKPIQRLNPDRDFDFWLKQYKHFLPSPQSRWCTKTLKIQPLERWIRADLEAGVRIYSYVAIRADESGRGGHVARHPNFSVRLPFVEHGMDKAAVLELLEACGVGLPAYYRWRSRSGCTFCFFQQKIEWVRLMDEHPQAFEEAKRYEKSAMEHDSPFTWSQGESLEELSQPERIAQIKERHQERIERLKRKRPVNPLQPDDRDIDIDELYDTGKGCLICHK